MRQVTIARVACDRRRRGALRAQDIRNGRDFSAGEMVRSCTTVSNDGSYPYKDVGEVMVVENDLGCVRESFSFLGELYYTVEFAERGVTVIMRGRELIGAGRKVMQ
jgi:nitrogen fixation protein NifZ